MSQMDTILHARFGCVARPFSPLADASVFHWPTRYTRACAALEYALISDAPFSVLTGPSGCGKTALLLRLIAGAGEGFRIVRVDAGLGDEPLLNSILVAFDASIDQGGSAVGVAALQAALIAEYAAGRKTLLVVDEAHNMTDTDLEALRLLSNINTASDQLLQVILSGHPPLRERLAAPGLAPLAQRIAIWASVGPLDLKETADYIGHRLSAVGVVPDLFEAPTISLIHAATGGVPRQINTLCELALIFAKPEDGDAIGTSPVRQILADGFFLPVGGASAMEDTLPRTVRAVGG